LQKIFSNDNNLSRTVNNRATPFLDLSLLWEDEDMKMLVWALMLFLGFGCAAKKMAVTNADFLLEAQIEKRLPLYAEQKEKLSKDVDLFLNQQKDFAKEVIPHITDIELDVKKVDPQYQHLKEIYKKLSLAFAKLMSKYMAILDEKQQKDFLRVLKEENHQMGRVKSNEQMTKLYDRLEILFGSLTEKQRTILRDHKTYLFERHQLRLERREKLHQRFREIYQMDLSKDSLADSFYTAFEEFQKAYPDDPRNREIIKAIIPTLTTSQKETFEERMKDLRELLGYFLEASY
jgi:hypothetical protein